MDKPRRWILAAGAMLATAAAVAAEPRSGHDSNGPYRSEEIGILPPHSTLDGKSLGDWGGSWWQWAFSFSRDSSPISDPSGSLCGLGQDANGKVWFLAGSYSTEPVVRECVMPAGRTLFFPIINFVHYSPRGRITTCGQVTEAVAGSTERPTNLFVRIDDKALTDPDLHREASVNCFDPFERLGDGARSWAYPAASNGYWIAVAPLSTGTHVLQFGGNLPNFRQNITYKLHVIPNPGAERGGTIQKRDTIGI